MLTYDCTSLQYRVPLLTAVALCIMQLVGDDTSVEDI